MLPYWLIKSTSHAKKIKVSFTINKLRKFFNFMYIGVVRLNQLGKHDVTADCFNRVNKSSLEYIDLFYSSHRPHQALVRQGI